MRPRIPDEMQDRIEGVMGDAGFDDAGSFIKYAVAKELDRREDMDHVRERR
ncbi:hypothetical protein [Salinigranum halophilum]|uniref:hypothetical protein n=1 Tax=Salinigranum halophilum TaxID=2565931 RepID=UPI00137603AD|nr:hypothetical protein [Salinigranum halophilum]